MSKTNVIVQQYDSSNCKIVIQCIILIENGVEIHYSAGGYQIFKGMSCSFHVHEFKWSFCTSIANNICWWSTFSKHLMSEEPAPCQTSLLNSRPLINMACLSCNPNSVLYLFKRNICKNSSDFCKDCIHYFTCHPCAGAMLIFSVSFQFQYMYCRSKYNTISRFNALEYKSSRLLR